VFLAGNLFGQSTIGQAPQFADISTHPDKTKYPKAGNYEIDVTTK
jgi:hypothetical protein